MHHHQFITTLLPTQVLCQYRSFLRTTRHVSDTVQCKEIVSWVREEFRASAGIPHQEEESIKVRLMQGEKMLKEMKQTVKLATAT